MEHILDRNKMTLYYDIYKYKVTLSIPGIQYFRYVKTLDQMKSRLHEQVMASGNKSYYSSMSTSKSRFDYHPVINILNEKYIGEGVISDYFIWYEKYIFSKKKTCKILTALNSVTIYTNDTDLIKTVKAYNKSVLVKSYYVDVNPFYVKGKIYHRNPTHKYRVYFSLKRIHNKDDIIKFKDFINHTDCKPSYSLKRELHNVFRNRGIMGSQYLLLIPNYYIDINDEKIVTMLALTFGDYVSKVADIVQR